MKRQFMIATLAAATVGIAGCGDESSAGRDVGFGIGALQTTTATKVAHERLDGINSAIESLDGTLPEATVKQLEQIEARLEDDVDEATNHPDALAEASSKAAKSIAGLSATDDSVKNFQEAVAKAYAAATGQPGA